VGLYVLILMIVMMILLAPVVIDADGDLDDFA
jgi:hypothetical protein